MSTGRSFHALGAAMENARSDETSLESGTTRSCLLAERREARPGMLVTGVTLGQVRRCTTIDCMEHQKAEFELDSLQVVTSPGVT